MKKALEQVLSPDKNVSESYYTQAVDLLQKLIAIPSFSSEEAGTAELLADFIRNKGFEVLRKHNNVWCMNRFYNPQLPVVLLNSHHDTVKPNTGYTRDPYHPDIEEGKLYGLGSNDAGASLVSLLMSFLHFAEAKDLKYNLVFAATGEEEISGINGIVSIIKGLGEIELAIIGEPTSMDLAVAEKGLMVIDCVVRGTAGHAAHNTGENAIYKAMREIEWFRTHSFGVNSEWLGPVNMAVTMVNAGTQHNVVPGTCEFTVDIRTTERLSNEKVLEIIKQNTNCEVTARSLKLQPSSISSDHAFVRAGVSAGCKLYGSPTISDQALLSCPSVKIGPGDSKRSHSSDEFVMLDEIRSGINRYIEILNNYLRHE